MWISALVRAFAWVVLLRREGVFNSALLSLGLIDRPLALIWNELGVVIGMVHYMLPYAVLPLYANMRDIDQRCIAAARGLGASRRQTFLRVFLPLSVPGIVGAGILVFVYSLGFFVTPAILGGGKTLMIAEFIRLQIVEILRWGTGTMLATVLIAHRAAADRRGRPAHRLPADLRRSALAVSAQRYVAPSRGTLTANLAVLCFLVLPIIVVLPVSLTDRRYLSLPEHGHQLPALSQRLHQGRVARELRAERARSASPRRRSRSSSAPPAPSAAGG